MLKINQAQMLVLITSEEGFVNWYVDEFMPDHLPEFHKALSPASLVDMVRSGRKIAMSHGFSQPDAIFHFVTLMWLVGPNFMDFPGFRDILAQKHLDDSARIDALYNVDRDLAAEAIVHANDTAWWRLPQ